MNPLMRIACYATVFLSLVSLQAQDTDEAESEQVDVWSAAESGDVEALQKLVKEGADLNTSRADDQQLPLALATRNGHAEAVKFLLESGADVDGQDADGNTAALAAAFFGYSDVFEALVGAEANLSLGNNIGLVPSSALQMDWGFTNAIANDALQLGLTEAEVTEGRTAILGQMAKFDFGAAIALGDLDAILSHIEEGADVNALIEGTSPLLIATIQGRSDIVSALTKAGADVDAQNQTTGGTALAAAAFLGSTEVAKALINAGADPSITDYQGTDVIATLELDYETTSYFASIIGIEILPEQDLMAAREAIKEMLADDEEEEAESEPD
ncbi:MAG: ankyrin repeat domain-containing protein [Gammaproteobacteria bacterium]|nr:ankyrin repeat domain-containing protein [Gammaproteobacteria bacterium]MYD80706.1 ankyrin repeat domain-containing protein [Gammaproteobacteria bacterium]